MAKREENLTLNRKLEARKSRESRQQRLILLGSGLVLTVLVIILAAGFVVNGIIRPNQPVAVVNGDTITTREFQTLARYQRRNLVARYLNTLDTMRLFLNDANTLAFFQNSLDQIELQLDPTTLGREVLNQLIEDRLIRQEASKRGISVTEGEIDKGMEEFFGYYADGTPTPTTSPTAAPTSTLSPEQLAIITATPTQLPTAAPTEGPTATSLPPVDTPTPAPTATPFTEEAFQELYDQTLDTLRADVSVSEKDLRTIVESQLYREKLRDALTADLPAVEEQVWARHILVDTEELALEVIGRLDAGEDFGEVAREVSIDTGSAARSGDLGWFGRNMMVSEFETAAWDLELGEISEPVQSQFGFHIIQKLGMEERPISGFAFENLRDTTFTEWLDAGRSGTGVEIREYWADRVPTSPAIPEGYAEQYLSQFLLTTPLAPTETPTP